MFYNVQNEIPYWVAVGIMSYGPTSCGTEGIPSVHTKVSSNLEWISETIRA